MAKIRLILFFLSRFLAASLERAREPSESGKRRSRGRVRRGRNGVIAGRFSCLWSQSCTEGGASKRESEGWA